MSDIKVQNEQHWHELRRQNIGSSDQPALWGVSPYKTQFQLWHEKRGTLAEEDLSERERIIFGQHLEAGIAMAIAQIHGLKIRKVRRYITHPSVPRMGASLDYEAATDDAGWVPFEIKNVDYIIWRDEWLHDGDAHEPPEHIDIQVQHQISCTEKPYAFIGVCVGGNTPYLIRRDRHDGICAAIKAKVVEFWKSVDAGEEPAFDPAQDLNSLLRVRIGVGAGAVDLRGDKALEAIIADWAEANEIEKDAKTRKDVCAAEALNIVGRAEKAVLLGGSIGAALQPAHEGFERVQKFKPQAARREVRFYPNKEIKAAAEAKLAERKAAEELAALRKSAARAA